MHIYCKNGKKTHWMCISKSKCAKSKSKQSQICLNDRTFFNKINDEYDLEQLVKHIDERKWRLIV